MMGFDHVEVQKLRLSWALTACWRAAARPPKARLDISSVDVLIQQFTIYEPAVEGNGGHQYD